MITLYVSVTTVISSYAVPTLGGKNATWEATQRMDQTKQPASKKKNAFANINPNGTATVKVGLEEKIAGPSGTYSSVAVRIEITARCDQSEEAIEHARDVLTNEGLKALKWYMGPALNLLIEHTEKGAR